MKEAFVLKDNLLWLEEWMKEDSSLLVGFTTIKGGTSLGDFKGLNLGFHVGDDPLHVLNNRNQVAKAIGLPLNKWVLPQQRHTRNVAQVTIEDLGAGSTDFDSGIPDTDGIYTKETGVVLATFYADCTPLYFYAPKHRVIALAHAGWRGTVDGIMHEMLKTLKGVEGIDPADIFVAIGPAIGRDAYQVDHKVINEVLKSPVSQVEETFVDLGYGQFKFDPKLLNYKQAVYEGIPKENILVSAYCTYTDSDLFYSHRRDGKSGRMLSFISLAETPTTKVEEFSVVGINPLLKKGMG